MDNTAAPTQPLDTNQLLRLHALTKDIAAHYQKQLRSHLETLSLLFRPRRALGDAIEGAERDAAANASKLVAELRDLYKRVSHRPFGLHPELSLPLPSVSTQLQLYEWEYQHPAKTERGWRSIQVTSPLTWIVTYPSTYSPHLLRQVLHDKNASPQATHEFVLRACLIHLQFAAFPNLIALLKALRYEVDVRHLSEFGDLPLVTISAPFRTFRPPDELVGIASGLSGGDAFAEVLDLQSARQLSDPALDQLRTILQNHGQEL